MSLKKIFGDRSPTAAALSTMTVVTVRTARLTKKVMIAVRGGWLSSVCHMALGVRERSFNGHDVRGVCPIGTLRTRR
jgi:hypothetical protein